MADIPNDPKEVGKWMKAHGVTTQYADKFLKALDKQVGKNAKKDFGQRAERREG